MKRISSLYIAAFALALVGFTGQAKAEWQNRPQVIRSAETLRDEVEHFDEAMHQGGAPAHFIEKVHHFEETVMEFAQMVRTCSYQEAYQEMNHIRQDIQMLRSEFNAHPQLLQNFQIYTEWNHVRTAYRYLDHEMFHWDASRWSNAKVETLMKDVKAMEEAHK